MLPWVVATVRVSAAPASVAHDALGGGAAARARIAPDAVDDSRRMPPVHSRGIVAGEDEVVVVVGVAAAAADEVQ